MTGWKIVATLRKLLNDRKLADVVSGILHWPFAVSTLHVVGFVRFSSVWMVSTNLNHPKVGQLEEYLFHTSHMCTQFYFIQNYMLSCWKLS